MTAGGVSAYGAGHATPRPDQSTVTLARGTTFAIVDADGSIHPGGVQGFYVDDTRLVSAWHVFVDEAVVQVLSTRTDGEALEVVGVVGDPVRPELLVERRLTIDDAGCLVVTVATTNLTATPRRTTVEVRVAADFADLFEVKRGVVSRGGLVISGALDDDLVFRYHHRSFRRGITVHVDAEPVDDTPAAPAAPTAPGTPGTSDTRRRVPDEVHRDGLRIDVDLPTRHRTVVRLIGRPLRTEHRRLARHDRGWPDLRAADRPGAGGDLPEDVPEHVPEHVLDRSWADLASLLMDDPMPPHPMIVAAGSPWFMALFGRDSLITSLQTLPYRTDLALGVLTALAARQGTRHDPRTLEQPGRIPHEARRGETVLRPDGWGATFYGTADATPLFVMVLGEVCRRGAPHDEVRALLPAAERAVEWMLGDGDPDGDGFVEYPGVVQGASGLANQGWKDSDDAIRRADGSLAAGPIAVVEVQGYCHGALVALADLYEQLDAGDADPWRSRAARLREHIHDRFWCDDLDCFALALDGAKTPVRTVSTNAGHLLFTGTAYPAQATRLAERLLADDVFTGFGLRTLSSTNPAFHPLSYHCGSVWPHDTALVAAGMLRAGHPGGRAVARSLLDAAAPSGRLPELFGGFRRDEHDPPVPYPTSCSPQAWAAGAPLLLAAELRDADRRRV